MRILAFTGLAFAIAALPLAAEAKRDGRGSHGARHAERAERAHQHRWGPAVDGRWHAGWRAPGGWAAYRKPVRGQAIPQYWFAPAYYIGDYQRYGLVPPPFGLAWSRYYDDAVLIDGRGTVYDSVSGVDWGYYDDRGYAGDRRPRHDYDYGFADDRVTADGRYQGRWSGSWEGRYLDGGTRYEGSFTGTYAPGVTYAEPPEGAKDK